MELQETGTVLSHDRIDDKAGMKGIMVTIDSASYFL